MSLMERLEKQKKTPAETADKGERPAIGHQPKPAMADPLKNIKKKDRGDRWVYFGP
jgi:hypothetical protein